MSDNTINIDVNNVTIHQQFKSPKATPDQEKLEAFLSSRPVDEGEGLRARYWAHPFDGRSAVASRWHVGVQYDLKPEWVALEDALNEEDERIAEEGRVRRIAEDLKASLRYTATTGRPGGNFFLAHYDEATDKLLYTRVRVGNRFRHVSRVDTAVRDLLG